MRRIRLFAMSGVVFMLACSKAPEVPQLTQVDGPCGDVFGGNVCTWGMLEGDKVVALGATVPLASIEGAPAEMEMAWPPVPVQELALPPAAQAATGLTHLTVFWEAHGHPPGAFLTPHFDFHFYTVGAEARKAIDCKDVTKPAALPAGYELRDEDVPGLGLLVGVCVPQMGMHALTASDLNATTVFDATMVIGYYQGNVIFNEPMIAKAFLEKRQDFTLPMPALPPAEGVHYPTAFRAVFDSTAQAYRFEFSGFGG